MDKDTTILRGTGFVVSPDHNSRVAPLATRTPAEAFANNVLEFIFKPAVETEGEMFTVIDAIYDKVNEIFALTEGLTKRKALEGEFHVGPMNVAAKPAELSTDAYSLQTNIGIEAQKIPDLFVSYAKSTELAANEETPYKEDAKEAFREALRNAAVDANRVEMSFRRYLKDGANEVSEDTPLLGLRGIIAVMSLYLRLGQQGVLPGGTVKNFTPLLLKTPISDLVRLSLSDLEKHLYETYKDEILADILKRTRGAEAKTTDLLVTGPSGTKAGSTVEDINPETNKAPYIVAGKTIRADLVGPQRDPTTDSSVDTKNKRRRGAVFETRLGGGTFDRNAAKLRSKENFNRVALLNQTPDVDLPMASGKGGKIDSSSYSARLKHNEELIQGELASAKAELLATVKKEAIVIKPSVVGPSPKREDIGASSKDKGKKVVSPPSKPKAVVKESRPTPVAKIKPPERATDAQIVGILAPLIWSTEWDNKGQGVFSTKTPAGVTAMRDALKSGGTYSQILALMIKAATERLGKSMDKRAEVTGYLYNLVVSARGKTVDEVQGGVFGVESVLNPLPVLLFDL